MIRTSNNTKRQIAANAESIKAVDGKESKVFQRITSNAPSVAAAGVTTKIFQARSFADPLFTGGVFYDRIGVYNCVEMAINDKLNVTKGITGTLSPSTASGWPNRVTDRQGATSDTYNISSFTSSDYTQWSVSTSYITGAIVEVISQYTDAGTSLTRKVSHIYLALADNTGKPPASSLAFWQDLTIEVFNACEQYSLTSSRYPKLAKFDVMIGNPVVDNQGGQRWLGNDTVGNTRIFQFTGDTTSTFPIADICYGVPLVTPSGEIAQAGELNYNTPLLLDNSGTINYDDILASRRLAATWVYGNWHLSPFFSLVMWSAKGLEQIGESMAVKVDGTTIDFDGTGHLKQI